MTIRLRSDQLQLRWQRGCLSLSHGFKLKSASGCAGSRRAASHSVCVLATVAAASLAVPCQSCTLGDSFAAAAAALQWKRFNFTAIHSTLHPDNNLAQLAAGGQAAVSPQLLQHATRIRSRPHSNGEGGRGEETMETAIE